MKTSRSPEISSKGQDKGVPNLTVAGLWQRTKAFLLDYLIIVAYLVLLTAIGVGLGFGPLKSEFQALFADPNSSELSAFLMLVLPIVLYFALFECSSWQATWGKRKIGLHVTDVHGARLTLTRSLARSLLKFVPWELAHACLWRIPGWPFAPATPSPLITIGLALVWVLVGIYLVTLLVSKKHQALYDMVARTCVVVVSQAGRARTPTSTAA